MPPGKHGPARGLQGKDEKPTFSWRHPSFTIVVRSGSCPPGVALHRAGDGVHPTKAFEYNAVAEDPRSAPEGHPRIIDILADCGTMGIGTVFTVEFETGNPSP